MPYDSGSEIYPSSYRGNPQLYRTGLAAADVVPAPVVGATSAVAGGSCTAGTYNLKVVAGNDLGRTPFSSGSQVTSGANLTVRVPLTGSTPNAVYYDVYCSTDADPKWVARITAAQLAAGALVTAVGVVGAGSIANAVDVQIPGTGNQLGTSAVENTAYVLPLLPVINCVNAVYVELDLTFSVTGDNGVNACVVVPFIKNANTSAFYQYLPQTLVFGGAATTYGTYRQKVRIDARAASQIVFALGKITGLGASLDIQTTLCS